MYESYFGFRERPFELTPNPRFLVMTDGHREAISNIEYAIAGRKGIALIVGGAGLGKTTVIRTAIERLPSGVSCVHLHNPGLTRNEFIEMLAVRFDLSTKAQTSKTALLLEFEELLRDRHANHEATVLIVDEAQTLPISLLEEIRLLANIETNDRKLLTVILAGQPELAVRLNDPSISQLRQRIALWCELRPLTFRESAAYVLGRIRAAGGVASQVFTIEAVKMIHESAHGIPRLINVIADNALMTGFAADQRPVNTQVVQEICADFRIGDIHHFNRSGGADLAALATPAVLPQVSESNLDDLPAPRVVVNDEPTTPTMISRVSRKFSLTRGGK